ncbi:MAG: cob(I)yrinic acid a,c-diamide adenosyltransferase [Pseudomonadota bacterium]
MQNESPWEQGLVQVYTGNGKGKTTAALGLALRAAGAGLKVFIGQFVKGMHYSEHHALARFKDQIVVQQFGTGCFIQGKPKEEDIRAAQNGLQDMKKILASGDYQVVILDEANIATHFGLFSAEALVEAVDAKHPQVEVIITGRAADSAVLEKADLVTEMKEVKHYFSRGVQARKGIEM